MNTNKIQLLPYEVVEVAKRIVEKTRSVVSKVVRKAHKEKTKPFPKINHQKPFYITSDVKNGNAPSIFDQFKEWLENDKKDTPLPLKV